MKASLIKSALGRKISVSNMLKSIYEADEAPTGTAGSTVSLTSAVQYKNIITGTPANIIYTYTIDDGTKPCLVSFTMADGKVVKVSDTSSGSINVLYNGRTVSMSSVTIAAATLTAFSQSADLKGSVNKSYNTGDVVKYCIDNKVPGFSDVAGFSA